MAIRQRQRGGSGSLPAIDPVPGTHRSPPGFRTVLTAPEGGNEATFSPSSSSRQSYPSSVPAWARPVSNTSSRKNSPAQTPRSSSPNGEGNGASSTTETEEGKDEILALSAGCQPDYVYKATLPYWRYATRRLLVKSLEWETPILADLQKKARAPFWDSYFIWSSIFGTHSAFMVGLPIFWWFGFRDEGLGLVNILSAGVYFSSFLKDLLCVPRPYNPPVDRLSISSHGLEYGFPSTHSTNAISISLYFAQLLVQRSSGSASYSLLEVLGLVGCLVYGASVVIGRLYCGMHSMIDCASGSLLGFLIWYGNLLLTPSLHSFLAQASSNAVPSIIIPLCLTMVSVHPEPVDDCPCFEDAIAFIAVSAGICIGRWTVAAFDLPDLVTKGSFLSAPFPQTVTGSTVQQAGLLVACTAAKLVVGVASLFLWRLMAKTALRRILPPIFKLVEPIISLPRKGYEQSSGYKQMEERKPMQPIPSLLDLTELSNTTLDEDTPVPSPTDASRSPSPLPQADSTTPSGQYLNIVGTASRRPPAGMDKDVKASRPGHGKVRQLRQVHYDVDVLTKVGVYSGIGYIATIALPSLFRWLGLDVSRA